MIAYNPSVGKKHQKLFFKYWVIVTHSRLGNVDTRKSGFTVVTAKPNQTKPTQIAFKITTTFSIKLRSGILIIVNIL